MKAGRATATPVEGLPFRRRDTTSAQRKTLIAAGLGWMLDAFDVLLYSIVLAELMRVWDEQNDGWVVEYSYARGFCVREFRVRFVSRPLWPAAHAQPEHRGVFDFYICLRPLKRRQDARRFPCSLGSRDGRGVELRSNISGRNLAERLARAGDGNCAEQLGDRLRLSRSGGECDSLARQLAMGIFCWDLTSLSCPLDTTSSSRTRLMATADRAFRFDAEQAGALAGGFAPASSLN